MYFGQNPVESLAGLGIPPGSRADLWDLDLALERVGSRRKGKGGAPMEGAGGGMRGGRQGKMLEGGNAYLDASFPKLDHLVRARIVSGR